MPTAIKPSVRIRMYRHGLGDCFLLTFKQKGSDEVNMLIDCGLLQGTPNGGNIMRQVVTDIRDSMPRSKTVGGTEKKILDHVLLTHEHYDHTSGFSLAKDVFTDMVFGQVWTSWLDDRSHPNYRAVRERFRKQILGLVSATSKMKSESSAGLKETVRSILDEFFDGNILAAGEDLEVRSPAWDFALKQSDNEPRFCMPGTTFTLPGLDRFRFYILGPPEDFESFTSIEPSEEDTYREHGTKMAIADSFFAAVSGTSGLFNAELCQPFEPHLRLGESAAADASVHPFFSERYGFSPAPNDWRRIEDDWLSTAGVLALNLDSYTNNTCLAIAIEIIDSGEVLLFPGDAQFANWKSWQKLAFKVPAKDGIKRDIRITELLERTVFYKVGHHGSHNATLKKHGLEMMTNPKLSAMIPVDRAMARSKTSKTNPHGWEMPEGNLFQRLIERTRGRVILADETDKVALGSRCNDKAFISNLKFNGRLIKDSSTGVAEPMYIEYKITG